MCGLVAVVRRSERVRKDNLENMASRLCHRGPDDHGTSVRRNVGLSHRRLSIVDLSSRGRQPFITEEGTIHSITNGEIYNYPELRNELESRNHQFGSDCDSEVVGHLYQQDGLDFVSRLDGMFALALHDQAEKKLVLARDPYGIKPLYYYHDENIFAVASEIKAFQAHPEISLKEQKRHLPLFFSIGFLPSPLTLFENIQQLQPAERIVFDTEQWELNREQYYELPDPSRKQSSRNVRKKIRETITEAVEKRLMSDVEIGSLLSGGIDSTLITMLAQQLSGKTFHSFTVGFDTKGADRKYRRDLEFGHYVANELGTNHHTLEIRDNEPLEKVLRDAIYHMDQPDYDPTTLTRYRFYEAVSNAGMKVVLSGSGADELFGGYSRQTITLMEQWASRVPDFMMGALARLFPDKLDRSYRRMKMPNWERYSTWYRPAEDDKLSSLFTEDFKREMDWSHYGEVLRESLDWDSDLDPLEFIARSDFRVWLPDQYLTQVDKTSMAHSLEVRVPFLDKTMVELLMGIPASQKISLYRQEKWRMREAFSDDLPEKVTTRKKQGLNSPGAKWLRQGLKEPLDRWLEKDRLRSQGKFNPAVLERMKGEHHSQDGYHLHILWKVMSYQIWRDIFF